MITVQEKMEHQKSQFQQFDESITNQIDQVERRDQQLEDQVRDINLKIRINTQNLDSQDQDIIQLQKELASLKVEIQKEQLDLEAKDDRLSHVRETILNQRIKNAVAFRSQALPNMGYSNFNEQQNKRSFIPIGGQGQQSNQQKGGGQNQYFVGGQIEDEQMNQEDEAQFEIIRDQHEILTSDPNEDLMYERAVLSIRTSQVQFQGQFQQNQQINQHYLNTFNQQSTVDDFQPQMTVMDSILHQQQMRSTGITGSNINSSLIKQSVVGFAFRERSPISNSRNQTVGGVAQDRSKQSSKKRRREVANLQQSQSCCKPSSGCIII
eukprot:403341294